MKASSLVWGLVIYLFIGGVIVGLIDIQQKKSCPGEKVSIGEAVAVGTTWPIIFGSLFAYTITDQEVGPLKCDKRIGDAVTAPSAPIVIDPTAPESTEASQ